MQVIIDKNEKLKADREKSRQAVERKKKYLRELQSSSGIYPYLPEIVKEPLEIKFKTELESKLYVSLF